VSAHGRPQILAPQALEVVAVFVIRWLPVDEERWRAFLGGGDLDEPPEVVFYCPECAEREFGGV
jgi:hypothetical protein